MELNFLVHQTIRRVLTNVPRCSTKHARATLSFPRRRVSPSLGEGRMGEPCALWPGVMGSRLRGNDSEGLSPTRNPDEPIFWSLFSVSEKSKASLTQRSARPPPRGPGFVPLSLRASVSTHLKETPSPRKRGEGGGEGRPTHAAVVPLTLTLSPQAGRGKMLMFRSR